MQIGIDLGGTKTEAIALAADSVVAARRRMPTPRDYTATLEAITRLVAEIESETGRTATVGVGIPGVVSRATGLVKNANSTWLIGRPLQADLEPRLARPVRVANDANCFTLSEAIDGAGRGFETVFGVILGTGVGGGIAIRQRIHEGPNQIAGEWGHNPLPWMTDEERAAGLRATAGRPGASRPSSRVPASSATTRSSPAPASSQDIVRAAAAGDAQPSGAGPLQRPPGPRPRPIINVLDPDAIVLGGGMSNLPDLPSAVSARLPRYVFSDTVLQGRSQRARRLERRAWRGLVVAVVGRREERHAQSIGRRAAGDSGTSRSIACASSPTVRGRRSTPVQPPSETRRVAGASSTSGASEARRSISRSPWASSVRASWSSRIRRTGPRPSPDVSRARAPLTVRVPMAS